MKTVSPWVLLAAIVGTTWGVAALAIKEPPVRAPRPACTLTRHVDAGGRVTDVTMSAECMEYFRARKGTGPYIKLETP